MLIDKNIPEDVLRDRLFGELVGFVPTAKKDEHKNLRTFQYFLEKITIIFEAIENKHPTVQQNLIRYTYSSYIRYIKGEKMPEWDGDNGKLVFGREKHFSPDQAFGFQFVDELIWKNTVDAAYVNEVLPRFAKIAEKKGN